VNVLARTNVEYADYQITIYPAPCPYRCKYCWSKLPLWIRRTENAHPLEEAKRLARARKSQRIVISFTSDPYQPREINERLTRKTVEILAKSEAKHQIMLLTKSTLISRDLPIFSNLEARYEANIWVGVTLTSVVPISSHEPLASPNPDRIKVLQEADAIGLSTWVSIEPWIPNVTYPHQIIEYTRDFVDYYVIGRLNYPKRFGYKIPKNFYREQLPIVLDHIKQMDVKFLIKKELRKELGKSD